MNKQACAVCGHERDDHVREMDAIPGSWSRREFCMWCPGYVLEDEYGREMSGYRRRKGIAWHRFREKIGV